MTRSDPVLTQCCVSSGMHNICSICCASSHSQFSQYFLPDHEPNKLNPPALWVVEILTTDWRQLAVIYLNDGWASQRRWLERGGRRTATVAMASVVACHPMRPRPSIVKANTPVWRKCSGTSKARTVAERAKGFQSSRSRYKLLHFTLAPRAKQKDMVVVVENLIKHLSRFMHFGV